jgi:hypothetical protein
VTVLRVEGVDELRLAAAYFGRLDKPTKAAIRTEAKKWAPMLVREVIVKASSYPNPQINPSESNGTPPWMAVAQSGKISVTNKGLVATFGVGRYKSKRRSIPLERFTGYEFGGARERRTRYGSRHKTSGKAMDVYRRVRRGMAPSKRKGYFVFPGMAEATPTLVAMWVRAIADVARGGPAGG